MQQGLKQDEGENGRGHKRDCLLINNGRDSRIRQNLQEEVGMAGVTCFGYYYNSLWRMKFISQKGKIKAYFILLSEENDWRRIGTVTIFFSAMTIGCNMFELTFHGWFIYCIISYGNSLKTNSSPMSRANSTDKQWFLALLDYKACQGQIHQAWLQNVLIVLRHAASNIFIILLWGY